MTAPLAPLRRSVERLVVIAVLGIGVQLAIPALWPMVPTTAPFAALLVIAWLLVRAGRGALVTQLVTWGGGATLIALMFQTGGPQSRFALYLPLLVTVSWSWSGRRAGLATLGIAELALLASAGATPPTDGRAALWLSEIAAASVTASFLAAVTRDLRRTVTAASDRALAAERAAVAAHAADEARDRFLAQVSHELRTPLNAILGYAELLREQEADPDRGRDLDRIHHAGRQLLGLVDDVLDLSREQAQELTVVSEPVDLHGVIHEVIETATPLVRGTGNTLRVRIDDDVPPVTSDRQRLRQILLNLVSNAAKYTSNGDVSIMVSTDHDHVVLTVLDTGIGIPADKLGSLFQPFVQLHEGADRRPGIGLGLALSQRLAARLGGRIEAASVLGVGSTFALRIPIAGSTEGAPGARGA
ncbi:MAG: HAMP domain-containing sensor histidine kinase [Myxococcota bacterium]